MKSHRNGFGTLEGLLFFIIAGMVVFIGWYAWNAKNNANSTYNASQESSTKSSAGAYSASTIVKIPELGIQITVPSSLSDLTYSIESVSNLNKNATGDAATLSTKALASLDSNCAADVHKNILTGTDTGGALGTIEKINGVPSSSYGTILLRGSGYFIFFQNSQSGCSQLQSAQVMQAQGKEALANALSVPNAVKPIQ